ncbi:amino acid/polyamine transporter I [Colletotrichum phormii]|uniref:Amino acid/polyamine transporter I n=1 Tax=Colletotrichum phormii TaxID=359342 RepID=A0AAJ0ED62_9PEZI|nr:amino acid/polyamine transporter I [Colletotrichum phormii]KAK1625277.1 amino acid/polyamine transporter I [Colletotrichum phormii]
MNTSNRKTSVSSEKDPTKPAADTKPSLLPSKSHDQDDIILRANGHNTAMRRQFSWMSALGLGFSITNSWVGYLSNFGQNLIYGGPQSCLFGLLAAFVAQFIITLGLSEIASAFPSSGGQYHFCYIMAPANTRRFAGYLVGWMSTLAWWIVTCSGTSLFAATLSGMIGFWHPAFEGTQWQIYLIYVGTATVTMLPVVFTSKKITLTVQISLYSSLIGFFIVLCVTTGMHKHTTPSSFITQSGLGSSGWSPGVAWILGITNAMYAFGGTDGAIHISEEISQPGRRVPQVMMLTIFIGLGTAFPLLLALMFFMTGLDAVTSARLPSLELINQATGNEDVTLFLFAYILLVYLVCIPSQWVTGGRLAWAFARDHGVPFSRYFSKIDEKRELPLRATIASYVFACLYGLLYLASTTAFNSIVTSAVLFLSITYVVPQGILLFQGRNKSLPPRYLNLGWFGYVCNVFSVLWIVILGVFICMPPTLPVTAGSMNYTCVVLVGLLGIVLLFWFIDGRKNFKGPNIDWDMIKALNSAGTATEGQRG